jgi:hypothetical protein
MLEEELQSVLKALRRAGNQCCGDPQPHADGIPTRCASSLLGRRQRSIAKEMKYEQPYITTLKPQGQ